MVLREITRADIIIEANASTFPLTLNWMSDVPGPTFLEGPWNDCTSGDTVLGPDPTGEVYLRSESFNWKSNNPDEVLIRTLILTVRLGFGDPRRLWASVLLDPPEAVAPFARIFFPTDLTLGPCPLLTQ
jgi:hypothetical protein